MNRKIVPPQPGRVLYENVFGRSDRSFTLQCLSEGVRAVVENADCLLADARLLADSRRYARAGFLVATAQEEIAKAYILLDGCRLDFNRHESQLRRLCKAFYDHVVKYAYYRTLRLNPDMPRRHFLDLDRIKEFFQNDLQRWWSSGDPESGEPDMPHDTYFTRDSNLYVDFSDWGQAWSYARADERGFVFGQAFGGDTLTDTYSILDGLKSSHDDGLFEPQLLGLLNDVFGGHYITEQITSEDLWRLYDELASRVETQIGIRQARVLESPLVVWPLYHFL